MESAHWMVVLDSSSYIWRLISDAIWKKDPWRWFGFYVLNLDSQISNPQLFLSWFLTARAAPPEKTTPTSGSCHHPFLYQLTFPRRFDGYPAELAHAGSSLGLASSSPAHWLQNLQWRLQTQSDPPSCRVPSRKVLIMFQAWKFQSDASRSSLPSVEVFKHEHKLGPTSFFWLWACSWLSWSVAIGTAWRKELGKEQRGLSWPDGESEQLARKIQKDNGEKAVLICGTDP